MTENEDNFEWARRLECPATARTNSVKNVLNRGIGSLVWDRLALALNPKTENWMARKNFLLYKLRHAERDASVERIKSKAEIKNARNLSIPSLKRLEKECRCKELEASRKEKQLMRSKALGESVKTKGDALGIKLKQTRSQAKDCDEMRLVCRHLMPATSSEIDEKILDDCLRLASSISTRTDKKMAWNKISESLSGIEIATLWNSMLTRRTRHTEELMALGNEDTRGEPRCSSPDGENMDIGIARCCGRYVLTAIEKIIHRGRADGHKKLIMDCIEKIELERNTVDLSEWLTLTLEVRKFEREQETLMSEIDGLKKTLEPHGLLVEELGNIESDIRNLDARVETCVRDIQKSLDLLKSAGSLIVGTRKKLNDVSLKIVGLRTNNEEARYLGIDLGKELAIFHDNLQLEALRKILIKDNIGAYRHTACCMNEGALAIALPAACTTSTSSSEFTMQREPIHRLLDCYKHLVTKIWLFNLDDRSQSRKKEFSDIRNWSVPTSAERFSDDKEILVTTDLTCDRIREEIRRFDSIFDAWNNQSVRRAMDMDGTVNDLTFNEWLKLYDTLLYMIKRTK